MAAGSRGARDARDTRGGDEVSSGDETSSLVDLLVDFAIQICQLVPGYTLNDVWDMTFRQINYLCERAAKREYEAMCQDIRATAKAISMAFTEEEKREDLPSWEEFELSWEDLQEKARRRERFQQSVYVVKGRKRKSGRGPDQR